MPTAEARGRTGESSFSSSGRRSSMILGRVCDEGVRRQLSMREPKTER